MGRAGFSPEKRMRTKVQTRALSVYRNPAAILVDQLREIHVDAELDVVEASQWLPRISRKDYTIGLNTTGNGVDDPDQAFFENFSCRSERNYNGYCNGEIERLFELQSSEPDPDKRRRWCGNGRQAAGRRPRRPSVEPQGLLPRRQATSPRSTAFSTPSVRGRLMDR